MSALEHPGRLLQETVTTARAALERRLGDAIDYARMQPEKALVSALAAGYVLRMLPLTRILRLVVRLALGLVKPAALIYGGARLVAKVRKRASS